MRWDCEGGTVDFISDDHTHDYHAVDTFLQKARGHLQSKGVNIQKEVQFSDGCAGQYKSKGPFADISFGGPNVAWHYFGSLHGKGHVMKKAASLKVWRIELSVVDGLLLKMEKISTSM